MTTLFNKRHIDDPVAQNYDETQEISKLPRIDHSLVGSNITSISTQNNKMHKDDNKLDSICFGKEQESVEREIENNDDDFEDIEKEPKHELHRILSYAIDDFHKICGELFEVISQGLVESMERIDEIKSIEEVCEAERAITDNRIEQATLQVSLFNSRILELTGNAKNGDCFKVSSFEDTKMATIGSNHAATTSNDKTDNIKEDNFHYDSNKYKENGKHSVTFKDIDFDENNHGDVGIRKNRES